jgi:cyclohexa-1,5-dienecarbonyl-CoA hydratase
LSQSQDLPSPSGRGREGTVEVSRDEAIVRITLNRPPLNILDVATMEELNRALDAANAPDVRVVVIRSALERGFSAGVDIRDHQPETLSAMLEAVRENAGLLLTLEPITIAAVHGITLGGGAEVALLCDVVVAASSTTIGLPEIGLGAFPPVAAACFPELCGIRRTIDLILGATMDATAAQQAGLISHVVAPDAVDATADALARRLAGLSGVALRSAKRAWRAGRTEMALDRLDAAMAIYVESVGRSADAAEGIAAFLEKREPAWRHH